MIWIVNDMNKQYLQQFSEQQLQHYLSTIKNRVKDIRQLNLDLGQQNKQLAQQYQELIRQKKELSHKLKTQENSWKNWIQHKTYKVTHILKNTTTKFQSPNNEYALQHPQTTTKDSRESKQDREEVVGVRVEGGDSKSGKGGFNFDDIYYKGRQKVGDWVQFGSNRINSLKQIVKGAYNGRGGENSRKEEQERKKQQQQRMKQGYQPMQEADEPPPYPKQPPLQQAKEQRPTSTTPS